MKTKRFIALLFFAMAVFLTNGCGAPVKYNVTPEFKAKSPGKVAVLPVVWHDKVRPESQDISRLFKTMTVDRLEAMGYAVLPVDQTDTQVKALGQNWFRDKSASDIARMLRADAVIYINITRWDLDRVFAYAGLKVEAQYEMDSAEGVKLWAAGYSTKEVDVGLDKGQMELAVFKTYEPRVRRFVDAVLSTLPPNEAPVSAPGAENKKEYYKWLP